MLQLAKKSSRQKIGSSKISHCDAGHSFMATVYARIYSPRRTDSFRRHSESKYVVPNVCASALILFWRDLFLVWLRTCTLTKRVCWNCVRVCTESVTGFPGVRQNLKPTLLSESSDIQHAPGGLSSLVGGTFREALSQTDYSRIIFRGWSHISIDCAFRICEQHKSWSLKKIYKKLYIYQEIKT